MKKNIYFYSNLLAWGLVLFLITNHIFGWTTPTENPPGGNITPSFSQWTTSGSDIYYNDGNVGIGTSTPGAKLEVVGQLKITGGTPGADKVLISDSSGLASWGTIDSGGACVVSGNDIVCSGIPADSNGSLSITKNGVTCPIWKDCDGDGYTYGKGDCDESCSTCYVGSLHLLSPDGKDQDCDGVIDEPVLRYYLFTSETHNANLGGRSGADSFCNSSSNKPECTGNAWAFISISGTDEIRDMPSTKGVNTSASWWFKQGSHSPGKAADDWANLLDGAVDNTTGTGGISGQYWTFSVSSGGLSSYDCRGAIYSGDSEKGGRGDGGTYVDKWLAGYISDCANLAAVLCACQADLAQ